MIRWSASASALMLLAAGCTHCGESCRPSASSPEADSRASASAGASSEKRLVSDAPSDAITRPSVVLTGKCTDANGRPVAGVHIILYGGCATRWQVAETTTGADGVYRFDPMTYGSMTLDEPSQRWDLFVGMRIEHATLASADGLSWWDVTVPTIPGHVTHKDFSFVPGGTVSGVLRERGSERPLNVDMRLFIGSQDSMQYFRYAKADENGRFRETALFPGHYTVDLNSVNPWYPVVGEFDVKAGGETVVDWRVDPAAITPTEDKTK